MADVNFYVTARAPEEKLRELATQAAQEIQHEWEELTLITYHESGHPPNTWAPLKKSTLRRKKYIVEDPNWMLLRTGRMISSNRFQIVQGNSSVTVFATNTAPYWQYHELGTSRIPKRQQLNPELYKDEFEKIFKKYFPEG